MTADDLLRSIKASVHHPATARELLQALRIPREERQALKRLLRSLVEQGALVRVRGNRFGLPERMDLVVGRLTTNPGGFGFVVPDEPDTTGDVYVAATALGDALHGDRVAVRVERLTPKGREGRIVTVIARGQQTVVGRFDVDRNGLAFVVPFDRRVLADVQVPTGQWREAERDDMVVVEITRWPTPARGPAGHVVEVLGRVDEPGVDTAIIIRKFGLPDAHGEEALHEADRLGNVVREADLAGRTDFRSTPTVTIDGEHARDFDDAITIARRPDGTYRLGVHIADVSHYVREGTALDEEAYERATSVYFTERAIHMFPAGLATGLCSLNPHVDRLVQSCVMDVDPHGVVVSYELHDGVINSDARMTYTAVHAIVEEHDAALRDEYAALVPMFDLMRELFEILHARRHRRGSIDFDLPEAEVRLSELGQIENIVASERNVAHRIIEEFMLLANETVAGHLVAHGAPSLHRVHEAPDVDKVADFEVFIGTLGYSLTVRGGRARPKDFQRLVEKIAGTPEERPISALMLRTMQKARYDVASLGHFGLATEHYTHFTSPIRRYPDLVVHRSLRELRRGGMTLARIDELEEELPEVARHTSERERRADEAERELLQWKKVRFMAGKVGDEFDGFVTGVAPFGLFVELEAHFVEGLVHVSSMADDYYRFVEQEHALFGENTKRVYRLGDRVRVQVVRADMERRQIDLGLVEILERLRSVARPRALSKSRTRPQPARPSRQRPGRRERKARRTR
jgi:ribonuclease R